MSASINTKKDQHLVQAHKDKLKEHRTIFQRTKRREDEIIERMQLLNPFVERDEEDRTRLDILVDEKISMSYSHAHADDFLE